MRSAPFAFTEQPWEFAWECAAITHGHIEAQSSAAIFAVALHMMLLGETLEDALLQACDLDVANTHSSALVRLALNLAASDLDEQEAISKLGEGWVADEAFAIATYAAVKAKGDFATGVRLAVNHDGDSDSTGAICGNILGLQLGSAGIPERWSSVIELRDVIEQVAVELVGL